MFFFFFLIIKLYFQLAPIIAKTYLKRPTTKRVTSMRMLNKEAKTGMQILLIVEAKLGKCSI